MTRFGFLAGVAAIALVGAVAAPLAGAQEQQSASASKADAKIYAQALVEKTLALHPELVTLTFHVTPPGAADNIIIASNKFPYGKKADEDDLGVITTGKPRSDVSKDGDRYSVEMPLTNAAHQVIGAVAIGFRYHQGDDTARFVPMANNIRIELAQQIIDEKQLMTPAEAAEEPGSYIDLNEKSTLGVNTMQTPMSDQNFGQNLQKSTVSATVDESYKYTQGLRSAGTTGYDLNFRGFTTTVSDRGAVLTDGLPGSSLRFGTPPQIAIDHLELIKGPASVLFGGGQPGGFINVNTRRPEDKFHGEVDLQGLDYIGATARKYPGFRGDFDITGPLTDDGKLLGRFGEDVVYRKSWRDFSYEDSTYLSPALAYRPDSATEIRVRVEHRSSQSDDYIGLVAPKADIKNVISRLATNYQEPGSSIHESGTASSISVSHTFDNNWLLNFDARDVQHDDHTFGFENNQIFNDYKTLSRVLKNTTNTRSYNFANLTLQVPFTTWFLEHNMVFGAYGGRDLLNTKRYQFETGDNATLKSLNISLYDPYNGPLNYNTALPASAYPLCGVGKPGIANGNACNKNLVNQITYQETGAGRVSDMISLTDRWKVLLAGRYDRDIQNYYQKADYPIPGTNPGYTASHYDVGTLLPMYSTLYEVLKDQLTVYTTYSTGFVPQQGSNNDIHGNSLTIPATARAEEVGAKINMFGGTIVGQTALFNIQKEHTPVSVTCAPDAPLGITCFSLSTTHSKGGEIQLDAKITDNWHVLGGYALIDAHVLGNPDPTSYGARTTNTPRHSFNIFSRYDITSGFFEGLGFGLSENIVDWRAGTIPTTPTACTATNGEACYSNVVLHLPGYATTDVTTYYNVKDLKISLKIGNVFNTRYYSSANGSLYYKVIPGDPENIVLNLRMPF